MTKVCSEITPLNMLKTKTKTYFYFRIFPESRLSSKYFSLLQTQCLDCSTPGWQQKALEMSAFDWCEKDSLSCSHTTEA